MEKTVEKYFKSETIVFPQVHKEGFTLDEFSIECSKCRENIYELRGDAIHHTNCIDIQAGVKCDVCDLITFSHVRMYEDKFMFWTDNGIQEIYLREDTWWDKIKDWFGL